MFRGCATVARSGVMLLSICKTRVTICLVYKCIIIVNLMLGFVVGYDLFVLYFCNIFAVIMLETFVKRKYCIQL